MECRFCKTTLTHTFVDLGNTAIANAFLSSSNLLEPEMTFPLKVMVCGKCFLVQTINYEDKKNIFTADYVYFSSVSKGWIEHCKRYVEQIVPRLHLDQDSLVIEVASNDGYLLQFFKEAGIPCLGIEPTKNTADIAIGKGIETIIEFFDEQLAAQLLDENRLADLVIGNNVLAHVPNLIAFVKGLKTVLKNNGTMTFEFPHFLRLIEKNEFDTIYHEHFSYFSLYSVNEIFAAHELAIFDVEELPTHGGSLRIYVKHLSDPRERTTRVEKLLEHEISLGMNDLKYYTGFQTRVNNCKHKFLHFITGEKLDGTTISAFGAAAKGNTFLNYCGVKSDLVEFVVDETPAKQGKYLPQSHIPVFPLDKIQQYRPGVIIILPWNFREEIIKKLQFTKQWGAKLVTCIPELEVF